MNAKLALYHACKRFRPADPKLGTGITAVAKLIDMSPDVLQKKLSPTCETHHITLDEAEAITEVGIKDAAVALASVAGYACVPMPGGAAEGSLMKGMSEIGKEFSDLLCAFDEALKDNAISPNECDTFQREALELFSATMAELGRMRALAHTRAPVIQMRSA